MTSKRAFEIAFVGLKPGLHEFNYEVDNKFFAGKEVSEFINCEAKVKLLIDKKNGFFLLKFEVGGDAKVICDKCGNQLGIQIWDDFNVVVKMVDNPEQMNDNEEDPDIFYISKMESHLDVEDLIYEFVLLSFPLQKMCSPENIGGPQCNKEVLDKLKEMEASIVEENANHLWKGLDQFKKTTKEKNKS
jgi:uncharacterized metal-binding protein YceD (DUF177 family)